MTNPIQQRLLETAQQLTRAGISIVATGIEKHPIGKWGHLIKSIATDAQLRTMFSHPKAKGIAIIGGGVSGNLYNADFEAKDYLGKPMPCVYPQWAGFARSELGKHGRAEIFDSLVITKTQNNGYHVRWRVETDEKLKTEMLAKCFAIDTETGEILTDEKGKPITNVLIESKAEGGCTLCPPSSGYELIQGDLTHIPTIPKEIHKQLVAIAKSFHTVPNDVKPRETQSTTRPNPDDLRPGDDFNQQGDHVPLLQAEGWVMDHVCNDVEYWRRPGKDEGWSATWGYIPERLYVFSSNANPFEESRTYDRFAIYAFLKYDGNFSLTARDLANQGFGTSRNGSGQTDEANESTVDEDRIFDAINEGIEKAAKIDGLRERTKQVKAIIERLVDLAPIDQSMFIEKMKQLGLGSKGTLEAQLKEATKTKKEEGPIASPTDLFHDGGEIRSAQGVYEGQDEYYKLMWDDKLKTYFPKPISSFIIQPKTRIWLDNKENLTGDILTQERTISNVTIHRRDWNSNERFKDILPSIDLSWYGNTHDVEAVKEIVASYDVPVKQGTSKLGLHSDGIWVLPDGAITVDGWHTSPPIVYLPRGGHGELDTQLVYPALDNREWHNIGAKIYANLLNLNTHTVMIPVISWFMAALFKPKLHTHNYRMPHLSIWGTRGAGKSTLMQLMWKLVGHKGEGNDTLFSCTETDFVMLKLLSSTTSIPIVLDEYKPYDMPPQRLKSLTRILRKAYDGETEFRGRPDQTTVEYRLTAPVVLAGEVALIEGASLERILSVEMSPNALSPDMRDAYYTLWDLPLQAFARRYIPYVMRTDVSVELAESKAMLQRIVDIESLPDRVGKNLTVMVFGFRQFMRFGIEQDVLNTNDNGIEQLNEAVLAMRDAVCGSDGVTRVALDYLIEHMVIMAETGRLISGRDYVIRETYGDIAIRFDSCFAEFRKYARETQLDGEILNAQAYRKQIKENHERNGYIKEPSLTVSFEGTNKRAVVIDREQAEKVNIDLVGFYGNSPLG